MNEKFDAKLDRIQEDVSEIKTHLAVYNTLLDTHIKRTDLLEKRVAPIEKHIVMVSGGVKLIGILAAIVAIVEVVLRWV